MKLLQNFKPVFIQSKKAVAYWLTHPAWIGIAGLVAILSLIITWNEKAGERPMSGQRNMSKSPASQDIGKTGSELLQNSEKTERPSAWTGTGSRSVVVTGSVGDGSPIVTGDRNIVFTTITKGNKVVQFNELSREALQTLQKELGATRQTIEDIYTELEREQLPPQEFETKLRESISDPARQPMNKVEKSKQESKADQSKSLSLGEKGEAEHHRFSELHSMATQTEGNITSVTAPSRVEIIIDGSRSMWGRTLDGEDKIVVVKRILQDHLINDLDFQPGSEMGLVVYGHREQGNCNDIERFIPVPYEKRKSLLPIVSQILPQGTSSIGGSLSVIGEAIRRKEAETIVILITDGVEECGKDPCAEAEKLHDLYGLNFRVHVVRLNIGKYSQDLECKLEDIAKKGGGTYFEATNTASLMFAIEAIKENAVEGHAFQSQPFR